MTDWQPVPGTVVPTRMRYTQDGKLQIREDQNTDLIVDRVADIGRALRETGRQKDSALGHYVGSVPLALYHRWLKEDPDIAHDGRKLHAKLMGSDYSKLRVK